MEKGKGKSQGRGDAREQVEVTSFEIGLNGQEKHIYRFKNGVYQHLLVVEELDGNDGIKAFDKVIKG